MGFHDATGRWRQTEQAQIRLPLASWYEVAGTPLAAFSSGTSNTPGLALDNSEAAGIRWNDASAPDPVTTSLVMPEDRRPDTDVIVHILASKSGTATSGASTTFDVGAFFAPVGALSDADATAGGVSSIVTPGTAKAVRHVTRTIAAADIPDPGDGPTALTLTLQPTDTTLTTDDVTVHAVWLEYERIATPD